MRKHFADLKIGERFRMNGTVYEKIEPVFAPKRGHLQYNIRNVKTGTRGRGRFGMVEVIDEQ